MGLIDRWWESKICTDMSHVFFLQPKYDVKICSNLCRCMSKERGMLYLHLYVPSAKMEHDGARRYWCHMCSRTVNPIREMNCPLCGSGFLEEMPDSDPDPPTHNDRVLSLLAPILLGFVARPLMEPESEDHATATAAADNADVDNAAADNADADQQLVTRQNPTGILQLLQSIRAGIQAADPDHNQDREGETRDGQRVILINQTFGDHIFGAGLDLLRQHLAENDPNRYGTPPAQREVVDTLPSVTIHHPMQCAVCLEHCEEGEELKEMPCKHKFHDSCIMPWLQLHSSCPVCNTAVADNRTTDNGTQFSVPLLWPFTALFSPSTSSHHTDN
ncbi:E3 ubiquitin-protein ligase SIRP1-like isoform X1 [Salvia splendens]|uniref:E3 ubiquitin-protein ligase SIRP1-like isoform X1 n=1 Tax=Salvia splendens TaxID=180675 RepID=UPI001C27E525|nr:E3 ubiquitin-protein ligase SIRP1-like isoform X1 [Salvia splendens]